MRAAAGETKRGIQASSRDPPCGIHWRFFGCGVCAGSRGSTATRGHCRRQSPHPAQTRSRGEPPRRKTRKRKTWEKVTQSETNFEKPAHPRAHTLTGAATPTSLRLRADTAGPAPGSRSSPCPPRPAGPASPRPPARRAAREMCPPHRTPQAAPGWAPHSAKGFGVPEHPPRGGLSPLSPRGREGPRLRAPAAPARPRALGAQTRGAGPPLARLPVRQLGLRQDARRGSPGSRVPAARDPHSPPPPPPASAPSTSTAAHSGRARISSAAAAPARPTVSGGARGHFSRSGRGEGTPRVGRHGAGRRLALPALPRSSGPRAWEGAVGSRGASSPQPCLPPHLRPPGSAWTRSPGEAGTRGWGGGSRARPDTWYA